MESSDKGIDVGGRVLNMLLAFTGDNEEQNRVFFKVKGKKVCAAATAKNRAIEVEGKAGEGSEEGEWPVEAGFLRNLASMTVNGSPKVPAVVARLVCARTGVTVSDLVVKESGKRVDTLQHHAEMPANKQLNFATIHKTISPDFEVQSSWYPMDKKLHAALGPVLAAVGKSGTVGVIGGKDEQSPVCFQAKGEDFVVRGILIPPAVSGPGSARSEPDDDDDEEEGGDDEVAPRRADRQTTLDLAKHRDCPGIDDAGCGFTAPAGHKLCPACEARSKGDDTGGAVIDDEEAERIKAEQAEGLPTAKKKTKRRQKNAVAGSR